MKFVRGFDQHLKPGWLGRHAAAASDRGRKVVHYRPWLPELARSGVTLEAPFSKFINDSGLRFAGTSASAGVHDR
jgi:hypothetical protein